jgi:PAS domain S-box-containing protein
MHLKLALTGGRNRVTRGLWVCLVWAVTALCGAGLAMAQEKTPGQLVVGSGSSYPLSQSFTYLEDATTAMTLADVLTPTAQQRFVPVPASIKSTNFGGTWSAYWLKVQLIRATDAPQHWLFELAYPPLDRMDLYVQQANGAFVHQSGGDSLPYASRVVQHRNHVKPIELLAGTPTTVYLRIASQGSVTAPVTLWQPNALWHSDQVSYLVYGIYFGLLIGLLVYNLLLYLSVRDTAYLVYVLFVACIGLSQAANSGLGNQLLWPNFLAWDIVAVNASHAASGLFALLFVRSFLSSKTHMRLLDRVLVSLAILWALTFASCAVFSYKAVSLMVTYLALVSVLTILCAGALGVVRRQPGARAFAVAWGAFLVGVTTQVMHNNGLLPSNAITVDSLLIGSSLEMVLLSFALADRINVARREKELAQAQVSAEQALVVALQQSQERYRNVIEHVAEGMVVVQGGRIVFVNFRATEILNATKADVLANGIAHRIHEADRHWLDERVRLGAAAPLLAAPYQVRLAHPTQMGDSGDEVPVQKWLEFGDTTVPWDGGQGLLVFFLDVTQRRNAELQTQAAVQRQSELNALRSRFIAMTSHEFRTPLAAILSAQDLLKSYGERMPPDQKLELLGMIESGVKRMTGMLERVLLLGTVDAHMLVFKPQPLDLPRLCQTLLDEAKGANLQSDCRVVMSVSLASPEGLFDETLLRHIFGNLLSNAIKYSPLGGDVHFNVFEEHGQTIFEVTDQGIGVPPDELPHLFDSFHRASNVGEIQGTGLGLAIVKQSVELHGGTVAVRNTSPRGTCFTVRLPVSGAT